MRRRLSQATEHWQTSSTEDGFEQAEVEETTRASPVEQEERPASQGEDVDSDLAVSTGLPQNGWPQDNEIADLSDPNDLATARNSVATVGDRSRLIPEDARVHYERGLLHAQQGDLAEAIVDHTEAIRLAQDSAEAYNRRGECYCELGELDAALADFTKAIELVSEYVRALRNRAALYVRNGHLGKAETDYARLQQVEGRSVPQREAVIVRLGEQMSPTGPGSLGPYELLGGQPRPRSRSDVVAASVTNGDSFLCPLLIFSGPSSSNR